MVEHDWEESKSVAVVLSVGHLLIRVKLVINIHVAEVDGVFVFDLQLDDTPQVNVAVLDHKVGNCSVFNFPADLFIFTLALIVISLAEPKMQVELRVPVQH